VTLRTIAFVYGVPLGSGGLGAQAGNALRALALTGAHVHAIGPGPGGDAGCRSLPNVTWHIAPGSPAALMHWTPLRRHTGLGQFWADRRVGRFAESVCAHVNPDLCFAFTQVALETMRWATRSGVATIVESPNGQIRAFRDTYVTETATLCGGRFRGHPTATMVERVEEELSLADRVRTSSEWSTASLVASGVPRDRITSLQQRIDLDRFHPGRWPDAEGPLRLCFVGSLDLRKGFVYLLRAVRQLGSRASVQVRLVGATGDRCSKALLTRERAGLHVLDAPGDPVEALQDSELFVLPTLEDGSPFAVAEAMASGRPAITTSSTGAAEWIRPGETGWVVPPRSVDGLAAAIDAAVTHRARLRAMGAEAARDTALRAGPACDRAVAEWVTQW
jgi:glycosyltransferase involved in cell wall biosynthesis